MKRGGFSNGFIRHSKGRNRRWDSRNEKTKAKFSPASPIDTSVPDADAGYAETPAAGLDEHQAVLHCSVLVSMRGRNATLFASSPARYQSTGIGQLRSVDPPQLCHC